MEMRQLAYFVSIARSGSFSKAAKQLNVAQPALSRQISLLEHELGIALLTRNGRGAVPTFVGKQFLQRATGILRSVDEAKWATASLARAPSGTIRIGVPLSVSALLRPEFFDSARSRFPHLHVKVSEAWTGHICRDLLEGKLEFGMLSDSQLTDGMTHRLLLVESVHLIAAPQARPASRSVRIADLAQMPLVLPPASHGIRVVMDRIFRQHGIAPRIVLESEVWSVIIDVVQKGIACSLLPPREVRRELAAQSLVDAPVRGLESCAGLCLARLSAPEPPCADPVFELMADQLRQMLRAASIRGGNKR